jgi:hypothetical protein
VATTLTFTTLTLLCSNISLLYAVDVPSRWNALTGDWEVAANWDPDDQFPRNVSADEYIVSIDGDNNFDPRVSLNSAMEISSLSVDLGDELLNPSSNWYGKSSRTPWMLR